MWVFVMLVLFSIILIVVVLRLRFLVWRLVVVEVLVRVYWVC